MRSGMCQRCVNASAPAEDGAQPRQAWCRPGAGGGSFLGSCVQRGGLLLLPRGLRNINRDGPSKKNTGFRNADRGRTEKGCGEGWGGRREPSHRSQRAPRTGLHLQPMWKQLHPNNTSCGTISSHFTEALLKNRDFINLRFRDLKS